MRSNDTHTAEPKPLQVAQARDCGLLFVDNPVRVIGQDCAYSIPLGDGEALWVFGDTLLGTFDESGRRLLERMPSSTGLLSAPGLRSYCYLTDEGGYPRQLLPWLSEEDPERCRIWPLHGLFMHGRVYLFYVRVALLSGRCWPYKFEVAGTGLAVARYPELAFERVVRQDSTLWWAADEPCYGAAVLSFFAEGMVYVYGTWLRDGHHYCSLARVNAEQLEEPEAYEYLVSSAPEWSPERRRAIPIMDGMPTEMSVSYNAHLRCYLAVHSWETTGKLVARTAPCPWGPWSQPQLLWTARVPLRNPLVYGGPLVYAGKEHPELAREQGRVIYLTFVEFEEYYPRLIEVTLE
jgi:hypothetical protein